jgi:chemotaxis protein MotB
MSTKPPIIIIKKKGGHGGHHGGAWKVAYADFVTAMMALFIVLWLMNSSKPIREAVGGYFKDPSGTAAKAGSAMRGSGESLNVSKDNMQDLKEALQNSLRQVPNIDKLKNHIEMTVTPEGLRIDLLESAAGTFFNSGNAEPSIDGKGILTSLAKELGNLPNKIAIEGHTDSKPYAQGANFGSWELSANRANAARRLMQQSGIGENQVMQVRGFANQRLRKPDAPLDPSNRRVSLIVEYLDKTAETDKPDLDKIKQGTPTPETQPAKAPTSEAPAKQ